MRVSSHRARLLVRMAVALALGLGLVAFVAGGATAAGGTLAGTVRNPQGAMLSEIVVSASRQVDDSWETAGEVATTDGAFRFEGLPPGMYRLSFSHPDGDYVAEYWEDARSFDAATDIRLVDDEVVDGLAVEMSPAARIRGTLTSDAMPVGAETAAMRLVAGEWQVVGSTMSDPSTGAFTIAGLPPGTYKLRQGGGEYLREFWNDARTLEQGIEITLSAGQTVTDRNADLVPAGHISGRVTDPDGNPIPDIAIQAHRLTAGEWESIAGSATSSDGTYDVAGLPAGTYRVGFASYNDDWLVAWWSGASELWSADDITVPRGGRVQNIDMRLQPAADVTGVVTDSAGQPLRGAEVSLLAPDGFDGWNTRYGRTTSSDGRYRIPRVEPGTYRVMFECSASQSPDPDRYCDGEDYAPEFFDDKLIIDEAADVVVSPGDTVPNIDAMLAVATGGLIAGTVTDAEEQPLENARVDLQKEYDDGGDSYWDTYREAFTDEAGTYNLQGLEAGTYRLRFSLSETSEYWDDAPTEAEATEIVLTENQQLTNVNAGLDLQASVSGVVTDAEGQPVSRVRATIEGETPDGWYWGSATSKTDGSFEFLDVPAGSYSILFEDPSGDLAYQYLGNMPTAAASQQVVVQAGLDVTDLEVAMDPAARISGTLTMDGVGVNYVMVRPTLFQDDQPMEGAPWLETRSSWDGAYEAAGLAREPIGCASQAMTRHTSASRTRPISCPPPTSLLRRASPDPVSAPSCGQAARRFAGV